jgi:SH3-like domain-containing protein
MLRFTVLLVLALTSAASWAATEEQHRAKHAAEPAHHAPRHGHVLTKPKPSTPNTAPRAPAPPPVQASPAPATPAAPHAPAEPPKGSNTGLPLPRFASLKTDEVNLRSGPGLRYPIDWVYKRRDLPVEIEREFEVWRLISDSEGVKGWVHQATLTGRRSFVIVGAEQAMRSSDSDSASAVAQLKPGVVGRLRACDANAAWCQVQVGDYRGWLKRDAFWGTYPGEAVQ